MGAGELLVPLDGARELDFAEVGAKAARLAQLAGAGLPVPRGLCLTTAAYAAFLEEHRLEREVSAELGRKPLANMRWEELWDAALRLRSKFLAHALPGAVEEALRDALDTLGGDVVLVARSSTPREDAHGASFAGLHESVGRVRGARELADAVRVVWASLWSDAALLYVAELGLDPSASRMAVVLQRRVDATPSGVAFGVDPRAPSAGRQIVEAVPGGCADLVDGVVDPDRWELDAETGRVLARRRGERAGEAARDLLSPEELARLAGTLHEVERVCGWPPDVEWTGRGETLRVLQARPVTGTLVSARDERDERRWYLTLRPSLPRLRALRDRVAGELIPALEEEGRRLAEERLDELEDDALAGALEHRAEVVRRWRKVYRDDFIPLAHGVRALGTFYADLVRPDDPFEFVTLVRGEELRALRRNRGLAELAVRLRDEPALADAVAREGRAERPDLDELRRAPGGEALVAELERLRTDELDQELGGERLADRLDVLLRHVHELARSTGPRQRPRTGPTRAELERRLHEAAGPERADEVAERLSIGRLSWRLRDDDNLLFGRVESQLLRALVLAQRRLVRAGRLDAGARVLERDAPAVASALRVSDGGRLALPLAPQRVRRRGARPRQLTGQPGAPGFARGPARHVRDADDVGRFRRGDVLLCDAIQPNMTLLVPLAAAIVERRGGMLVHGAIIARELGIPCVNGVSRALADVEDGQPVVVDGDLGIVTVGEPELRLEGVDDAKLAEGEPGSG